MALILILMFIVLAAIAAISWRLTLKQRNGKVANEQIPPQLQGLSLVEALQQLLNTLGHNNPGIKLTLTVLNQQFGAVSEHTTLGIYHAVEVLAGNLMHNSHATVIDVIVAQEDGTLHVKLMHNGSSLAKCGQEAVTMPVRRYLSAIGATVHEPPYDPEIAISCTL